MGNRKRGACDHSAIQNLDQELRTARAALESGDVRHAGYHAAGALALDPNHADALALVDQLAAWRDAGGFVARLKKLLGAEEPVVRAPAFPQSAWWGNHLARARAAWLEHELAEAFGMVVSIASHAEHIDLAPWWNRLLDEAEAAGARMPVLPFLMAYAPLCTRTIGLLHLRPLEMAFYGPWTDLGLRLMPHAEQEQEPQLAMMVSALLRRAGRFDDAVAMAQRGLACADQERQTLLHIQLGLAQRAAGRFDQAIGAFLAADPDKDKLYGVEIARVYTDAQRVQDALHAFARYGAQDDHEVHAAVALLEHRAGTAQGDTGARLADLLDDGYRPAQYDDIRRLLMGATSPDLDMQDASTNVLFERTDLTLDGAQLVVTVHEAPSVRMTLGLAACGSPDPARVDCVANAVPKPDPGEPLDKEVGIRLWRREGGVLVQAVPPPTHQTREVLVGLSARRVVTSRAWLRARELGATLNPKDVVHSLVHPSPPPPGVKLPLPTWVFNWQRAACLLLGASDLHVPWARSTRRTMLRAVLCSHPDWTTAAALHALVETALDDPEAMDDARAWCIWLSHRAPDRGHCCWAHAMERVSRVLPGMPPDLLAPLRPWLEEETPEGG